MVTTAIEKNNLEAHTELCAERYDNLQTQLSTIETRMDSMEAAIGDLKQILWDIKDANHSQLVSWGVGLITTLLAALGALTFYVITNGKAG